MQQCEFSMFVNCAAGADRGKVFVLIRILHPTMVLTADGCYVPTLAVDVAHVNTGTCLDVSAGIKQKKGVVRGDAKGNRSPASQGR